MMGGGLQAGFLGEDRQRLFVVRWSPQRASNRCVLVVPPFADEMNKSRHLLAQAARGLADEGWHVVLPDLYGTGDSDGEFADASWSRWKRDLGEIIDSVRGEGLEVGALVGVRTGALLA
ncbi:MAG: hydrolase 2, exosortase A system-associated, partial [Steroidobacteraceae bacterium]